MASLISPGNVFSNLNISVLAASESQNSAATTFELGDQLASYFGMAATCLLTYDIITTIDKEIHFFWKSRGHLTTWVFFLNRYIGFFAAAINTIYFLNAHLELASHFSADSTFCAFGAWSHQLAGWAGIVLIDGILLMRVLALCPDARKLARFLMLLFAAEAITSLGLLLHVEIQYRPGSEKIVDKVYCGIRGAFDKQSATAYWTMPMIFELVLLAVATHKTINYWGSLRELGRFKLASILLRDQVIYFLIVITCSIASITVYWIDASNFQAVVSGFANASLPCVLGSHLLFNLKEAGEKDMTETIDSKRGSSANTNLRFGSNSSGSHSS